ncbi:MAG TPA: PAS domain S-box protein, partial [Kouleothrix sp.]|nr:PAS domain S-box protein [Kouleothrix sp.]HRC75768.1 PAS domain S-box protein [Kouleothrix sp.]
MAHILIFDDSSAECATLATALRQQGHQVELTPGPSTQHRPAGAHLNAWGAYLLALGAPVLLLLVQLGTGFIAGDAPAMVLFVLPIILCAYAGGFGPGLLATIATALGVNYFLLAPHYSLAIGSSLQIVQWLGLIAAGLLVSVLSEALQRARSHAEASQQLHAVTLASISDGVIATDAAGVVTFVNAEAARLTGWNHNAAGQALGTLLQLADEHTHAPAEDPAASVLRTGAALTRSNHLLLARDGRELPIDTSGAPIRDTAGKLLGAVLVLRDRSDQASAEAALRASEQRFRNLAENSPDIIYIIDLTLFRATYLNQPDLLGYTLAELQEPGSIMHAVHPDDAVALAVHWQRLLNDEETEPIEYRLKRKDGQWEWLHSREKVIARDPAGRPTELLLTLSIIGERRRMQEQLATERYWLRTLIDNLPDLIFLKDTHSRFVIANQATAAFMGVATPAALSGKSDFDFYPKHLAAQYYAIEQQIITSGQPLTGWEKPQLDLAGKPYWLMTTKLPLRDSQNQTIGLIGIERDITARKQAELQASAHAAHLQLLADAARSFAEAGTEYQDVLDQVVRATARLLRASCALRMLSGDGKTLRLAALHDAGPAPHNLAPGAWGDTELRADDQPLLRDLLHTSQPVLIAQPDQASMRAVSAGCEAPDEQLHTHSMIVAPLLLRGQLIGLLYMSRQRLDLAAYSDDDLRLARDLADRAALAIGNAQLFDQARRELERRQDAERALRESEQQYRKVIEAIADGMFVAQDQRFVFANRVLPAMLGYQYDEFIYRPFGDVVAPEFLALWNERFAQRIGNGPEPAQHYEARFLRQGGEPLWVEVRASRMQFGNRPAVLGLIRDITERKQAESQIRQLNSELERRVAERTADLARANASLQAEIAERTTLAEQIREHARYATALAELSQALAESGTELQPLFDTLAQHISNLIGDACIVTLLTDDGQWLNKVAMYHSNPDGTAFIRQLLATAPYPVKNGMASQVVRTGEALLLATLPPEQIRDQVQLLYQPYLDRFGIASLLIVPLRARGRILGTLGVS